MKVLGGDGFALDGALAAEVDLDRPRTMLRPPLEVDVAVPLLGGGVSLDLALEGVKGLSEVVGGRVEGAVAVGEGDADDEEVGRREGEEDREDVVDAGVGVAAGERISLECSCEREDCGV